MASPDAPAKCLRSYPKNSKGQDYCDIALKLGQVCAPDLRIRPLVGSDVYHGPYDQSQNSCRCSSVFYSMLGACGWCQSNNGIDSWSTFILNCSRVTPSLQEFPAGLPRDGTPVPLWAFQADVRLKDGFQPEWIDSSQRLDTETAAILDPTSSPAPTTTTSSAEESSTGSSDTSEVDGSRAAGSKKANVGAIAGGAVAGVVVLLLICCLVIWFIRKRNGAEIGPSAEEAIVKKAIISEQPVRIDDAPTDAPPDNGTHAEGSQAPSQAPLDVPDFEPPPYQPSESGSMYVGSSQSGLHAASTSGSSYPSEKSRQVFLRPTN